jgi:hypothetical protein
MGLRDWWNAVNTGVDVADELIEQDETDISEGTLRNMAQDLNVSNADTFVETVFESLNESDEDEWTRENGTGWEQFRRGTFSDDHPILRRFFG